MTGSSTEQASHVFGCLHGMVRTAALYPPMHGQTVKAKQTLHEALTTYLSAHGRLVYGFVGDVLVADNRILPRESLLYRRFLALCQNERHIGSISFIAGVEPREIDALLEAVTNGAGDEPSSWASRKGLTHVLLRPPVQPEQQNTEAAARRAYYGSIETLRDIQATVRARSALAVEQIGTLRVFTSTILEQMLESPALVLRLASIKSYDEYTLYHSVNVAVISVGLGLVLGLPEALLREVAMAGMLHDVGKIAMPLEILQKPGPLDAQEWRIMRRHPLLGADLLSRLPGSSRLPMIVAFEHHLRLDTQGYPSVPAGWVQHPLSRLACVADVFDAMTSRRHTRRPFRGRTCAAISVTKRGERSIHDSFASWSSCSDSWTRKRPRRVAMTGPIESIALEGTALTVTLAPALPVDGQALATATARRVFDRYPVIDRVILVTGSNEGPEITRVFEAEREGGHGSGAGGTTVAPRSPSQAQPTQRFGDLLVSDALITQDQFDQALAEQKRTGGKLGEILVRLGVIAEARLVHFLSRRYGIPEVAFPEEIAPEIIKLIPGPTACKYGVVPTGRTLDEMTLAVADPTDVAALDDIALRTGLRVVPRLTSLSIIRQALERYYDNAP